MAGTCQHSLPGDTRDLPPRWRTLTNTVASLGVSSAEMKQRYKTVTRLYRLCKLQECVPSLFTVHHQLYTLQAPSSEGSVVGWWSPHPLRAHQGRRGVRGYLSHQIKWFTNFCCQNVVIYIGASFFCQSLSLMPGKDCGKCSTLIFRLVKRGGVRGVALHTNQLYIRVITLGVGRSCSKLELKNAIMETLNTLKHEHCRL